MSAHPPVMSGGGLLGHLRGFRAEPLSLLRQFNDELGDVGCLRFASTHLMIVNTPDSAKELLVTRHASFRKSRVLRAALYPIVGEGLFTSDGELWRRQRKLMAPIFQAAKIAGFDACMTDCAAQCVARWSDGDTIEVLHETTGIAMNVASLSLFGVGTDEEGDELTEALTVALEWAAAAATSIPMAIQVELADGLERAARRLPALVSSPLARVAGVLEHPILWPTAGNRRLARALAVLDARVARMIATRRAAPDAHHDLLSRLLNAHQGTDGPAMSDRQLRDEVLTLFVAGHETTATALAWALHLLARHPDVRDALEREVDALGDRTPTADDLPRLALASGVFKEALRLYPPVPVYERQAIEPVTLAGYALEPGAYVGVFPWALHHRAHLWPEPDRFDPARFEPARESERDRYAYMPFGAGPRVCIGNHFALQEGPLVLATIVRHARLSATDDREIEPDPKSATFRPRGGVPMRVRLRRAPA